MTIQNIGVQTFPMVFVNEFGKYTFTNYRKEEIQYYCIQTLPKIAIEDDTWTMYESRNYFFKGG